MVNYVPERIYKLIKDDPKFIEFDDYINKVFNNCGTLVDVILMDSGMLQNKSKYEEYKSTMMELCEKYCPEWKIQMEITVNPFITKDQLLEWYMNKDQYDRETVLYILSYIINNSYQDYEFNAYQKIYHKFYNDTPRTERMSFSTYIHLKYINSTVEDFAINNARKDENYFDDVYNLLTNLYYEYKPIIANDLLKYIYLEIFDHTMTNAFRYVNNDDLLYEKLKEVEIPDEVLDNPYRGFSINELGILDKQFELAFSVRKFDKCRDLLQEIVDWITNAFNEPKKLFRTLCIYDKVMASNFSAIVRRYIKLLDLLTEEVIHNINKQDMQFLLRDDYSGFFMSNQASTDSFNRLTKHVDDWFKGNEETLDIFVSWWNADEESQKVLGVYDV